MQSKAARWYLQAAAWVQDQERFGVLMHSQNKRLKAWQPFSPKETQNMTALRFNCINPGATRTNMRAHAFPGEDPYTLKTPEDIMPVYVFDDR